MPYRLTIFSITVLVAILTALAVVNGAHATNAPYDFEIGREARYALDMSKFKSSHVPTKFVYARCYETERLFNSAYAWRGGNDPYSLWAYAMPKSKTIYLRPSTCQGIREYMKKLSAGRPGAITTWEVGSYATLLHEALHVQGVKDERTTECLANDSIRWAAMGLYDISKSEANRLSRMAFDVSAKWTSAEYHSVSGQCQYLLSDFDWTDFLV